MVSKYATAFPLEGWHSTTLDEFSRTLTQDEPPNGMAPALQALWWLGKGQWDAAHRIVMDASDRDCAWVHAHLHRVEGDLGNADYWYRRAKRPPDSGAITSEWETIADALLAATRARNV